MGSLRSVLASKDVDKRSDEEYFKVRRLPRVSESVLLQRTQICLPILSFESRLAGSSCLPRTAVSK